MSTQDPFDQQFPDEPNPYARNPYTPTAETGGPPPSGSNPLLIPAIFLIVFASLTVFGGVVQLAQVATNGVPQPANQDPAQAAGFTIGFWSSAILIPVMNLVVVAGGIAMLRRKAYALAMSGAICGVVPICGPCLVLGIPFAIWALVLLNKPEVKASFG
ncbi:MAG: hypothetical protein HKN47_20690 [Pirellulaceae bacterium]|nr:hypothetical protein [Pirellulaceae bacterium]